MSLMARKKKSKVNEHPCPSDPHVRFGADYLRQRLALLRPLVPRRAPKPIFQTYHFDVRPDDTAVVGATEYERSLLLNLEVLHVVGSGHFLLDAHALDALLGSYVVPTIEFSLDMKADAMLATGHRVRATVPAHDVRDETMLIPRSMSTSGWL